MRRLDDFWYLLISLRATVPAWNLGFFLIDWDMVSDLALGALGLDILLLLMPFFPAAIVFDGTFFDAFLAFGIVDVQVNLRKRNEKIKYLNFFNFEF